MNSILKDTFREIKKTKSRFISIMAIVLIGVGFFAGVWASAPMMRYSVDKYYDEYNLMDFRIVSNLGLTEEDMEKLRQIDGVEKVYPAYTKDFIGTINGENYVIKVSSFDKDDLANDDYVNKFQLVEGRMPQNENEILFEKAYSMQKGINVNDKVTLSLENEDVSEYLNNTQYTVVGLIHTPYYLSYEKGSSDIGGGVCNYFMYIDSRNFNMDVYTDAFVTVEGAKEYNSYNDEYFDYISPVKNAIEDLGYTQSDERRNDIIADAQSQLDEAKEKYQDGKTQFDEEIAKAEKEIQQGEEEILLGKAQLESSQLVLDGQIESGKAQLEMYKEQFAKLENQYNNLYSQYQEANGQTLKQIEEINANIEQKQQELDAIQPEIDSINGQIDQLNTEKTQLENNLNTNNLKIEENNNRISQIDEKLSLPDITEEEKTALQTEKTTLQSENQTLSADNITLQTQITEKESKISELENSPVLSQQQTLNRDIQLLQSQVDLLNQGMSTSQQAMNSVKVQIDSVKSQITQQEDKLYAMQSQAESQIAQGKLEIQQAEKQLEEGKITLEEKRTEGQQELDDAYEEILKAENEISLIENGSWYVLDRNSHYSYVDYGGACDRMENIAVVFPVFFFLVAALVCLTTMTRLVDEQRQQIGTLKALGYSSYMIMSKYIIYAVCASLVGSVLGLAIGLFLFPYIIYTAWTLMYIVPGISFEPQWALAAVSVILSVFITTAATVFACYKELLATPSTLMRPKAPKMGKKILIEKIGFIWNRLSFTLKVTFRNIFRYKKRMSMTIIGIAGCTSLLIAGFGIKDSISDLVNIQFEQVFQYDGLVSYEKDISKDDKAQLISDVESDGHITEYMDVSVTKVTLPDCSNKEVSLVATQDTETFKDFVNLRTRKEHTPVSLNSDGAVITEKLANDYNLKAGDEIKITNSDNFTQTVKISAVAENYVDHYIYMTSAYYESVFGLRAKQNTLLLKLDDAQNNQIVSERLNTSSHISSVSFYNSFITTFEDMINSLNYIVLVLVISAGALAFVVLYNLTNVNISERQREIATLKVLGFYPKEVKKYIYYENIFLTVLGSLCGLLLGKGLHLLIMVVVELEDIMFGRNIEPVSFVYSFVLTVFFAVIVNQFMAKKLRKIQMVESLKSVE